MTLEEQYKQETGEDWWWTVVSHGKTAFCSDNYMQWLKSKHGAEQKEKEAWKKRCVAAENVFKGQDLGFEGADFLEWQSTVKAMEVRKWDGTIQEEI